MIELAFVLESRIFDSFVNGPLVKIVIFDPWSIDSTTDFQTSNANGCLSCGKSVLRGAPKSIEFSAVYLQNKET